MQKLDSLYIAGGDVKWCSHCGQWCNNSSKNWNIGLLFHLVIPLLGIYPKEVKAGTVAGTCTFTFIAALFTTAKMWKQPRCVNISKLEIGGSGICSQTMWVQSLLSYALLWEAYQYTFKNFRYLLVPKIHNTSFWKLGKRILISVIVDQWSSTEGNFSPSGHLAKAGDIFSYQNWDCYLHLYLMGRYQGRY